MGRRLSPWPAQTEMVAPEIQEPEISENLSFPGNLRADHEPKTISTLTRTKYNFNYIVFSTASMSALARGAAQAARVSRLPIASASTSRPLRRYATETALPSSSTGVSQADVVLARPQTSRAEQRDGTTMKKYTGKGFPMIPVSERTPADGEHDR